MLVLCSHGHPICERGPIYASINLTLITVILSLHRRLLPRYPTSRSLYGIVLDPRKIHAATFQRRPKQGSSIQAQACFQHQVLGGWRPLSQRLSEEETEKVLVKDLAGEELWTVENVKALVYNTQDGTFIYF